MNLKKKKKDKEGQRDFKLSQDLTKENKLMVCLQQIPACDSSIRSVLACITMLSCQL